MNSLVRLLVLPFIFTFVSACIGNTANDASLIVSVSAVDVKTVKFNWNAITNATSYKLYVDPDGASGFTLQTDNISGNSTALTLPVHLIDWVNATYKVKAYKSTTLLVSSKVISIASEMLNAVGYAKASNAGSNDNFGYSVSLSSDGNTLAVGSIYEDGSSAGINGTDNDSMTNTGAVYIYTRSGTVWSQQAYVKASNPTVHDYFGHSVSVSSDGNTLAVGAWSEDGSSAGINGADNDSMLSAGAAYVFTRSVSTWTQQAYVKASYPSASDYFGRSVSISSDGNMLAVGSVGEDGISAGINNGADNDLLSNAGAVYVFTRSDSTWSQQAYVKANVPIEGVGLGSSLSVSSDGNTLVVGAVNEYRSGAVYVFTRTSPTVVRPWVQQAYVKASNPFGSDHFGYSVSVSSDGNTLAVGAYSEDGSSAGINGMDNYFMTNTGAVYIYIRSGTTWTQQAYVKASNPTAHDLFGSSVSISSDGNTLAVGATSEDGNNAGINGLQNDLLINSGTVYIY